MDNNLHRRDASHRGGVTAVLYAVLAFVAGAAIVWGAFISPAPANEVPPPQEVGWSHRNFR